MFRKTFKFFFRARHEGNAVPATTKTTGKRQKPYGEPKKFKKGHERAYSVQ